ncbi:EAL and HDOD domain-containing protein [Burkholderia alba]|uniref:EAL and HDOD domain-containing protein n=1 Tax=Burkholderia alba TaxID=2683677 RepID=UPI002B061B06|nr:EAL domain-containing protein [Burkholderia alba]
MENRTVPGVDAPDGADGAADRAAAGGQALLLGRQPLVDRDGLLCGFELGVRDGGGLWPDALVAGLRDAGVRAALGGHKALIDASRPLLFADALFELAPERYMFELPPELEVDADLIARLVTLHRRRYRFVLDRVSDPGPSFAKLLPYAEAVKIDVGQGSEALLRKLVDALKTANKKLIALNVETPERFEQAKALGFVQFQGYFFAHRHVSPARRVSAPRHALLNLMQLLATDPNVAQLEAELKLNPVLVMHLMRLANTGEAGFGRQATTLREAIAATGTNRIARWTQILLYADGRKVALENDPLVQLAATRARFMELAAVALPDADRRTVEAAFLVGALSLIDAVFGDPIAVTLDDLTVSPTVRAAILDREGVLGALLDVIVGMERGDWPAVDDGCARLGGWPAGDAVKVTLKAAAWAASADYTMDTVGLGRFAD